MALFSVPGVGHAEALDLQHLAGWNAIAKDPVVRDQLRLPELSEGFVAGRASAFANFADDARTGAMSKYELVVGSGDVVAAINLSCYICSDDEEDYGGVSVDIAMLANCRAAASPRRL